MFKLNHQTNNICQLCSFILRNVFHFKLNRLAKCKCYTFCINSYLDVCMCLECTQYYNISYTAYGIWYHNTVSFRFSQQNMSLEIEIEMMTLTMMGLTEWVYIMLMRGWTDGRMCYFMVKKKNGENKLKMLWLPIEPLNYLELYSNFEQLTLSCPWQLNVKQPLLSSI